LSFISGSILELMNSMMWIQFCWYDSPNIAKPNWQKRRTLQKLAIQLNVSILFLTTARKDSFLDYKKDRLSAGLFAKQWN